MNKLFSQMETGDFFSKPSLEERVARKPAYDSSEETDHQPATLEEK